MGRSKILSGAQAELMFHLRRHPGLRVCSNYKPAIARHCFAEGVYRGACNVIDGKSLAESIREGREASIGRADSEAAT